MKPITSILLFLAILTVFLHRNCDALGEANEVKDDPNYSAVDIDTQRAGREVNAENPETSALPSNKQQRRKRRVSLTESAWDDDVDKVETRFGRSAETCYNDGHHIHNHFEC